MTIHFDNTIIKIDKDGNRLASSYIAPGEKLENGQSYEEVAKQFGGGDAAIDPANDVHVLSTEESDQGQGMTLDESGTGTAALGTETGSSNEGAASGDKGTEGDEDKAPAKSANKDEWFAYAQAHGYEGEEDDITKDQLIEQYGPKED